jgi:hypothetical protein
MPLSEYKNIFGKPNEGVHSYRIFNLAIIDVIFTIIGGYIIANLLNWSKTNTIIGLFILGIFMHRLFDVKTTIDKIIF